MIHKDHESFIKTMNYLLRDSDSLKDNDWGAFPFLEILPFWGNNQLLLRLLVNKYDSRTF